MSEEMPDEANRYDGKPAQPPEGGPTQEDIDRGAREFEEAVEFVKEMLESDSLSEVVLEDTGYGKQVNVNIKSLADKQGRSEEYTGYFEHIRGSPIHDHGVHRVVKLAAKRATGVEFREVDSSDE